MTFLRGAVLILTQLFLISCQSAPTMVTIHDGNQSITVSTDERMPEKILSIAGVNLAPEDRLLWRGLSISPDQPILESRSLTLDIRRVIRVNLITPDGTMVMNTSALTVGQALAEKGFTLSTADQVSPSTSSPLADGLTITYLPAQDLTINADGNVVYARSSARSVGQALAEAGLPLLGLDYSIPSEDSPLPADGHVWLVRVTEIVTLESKLVPYSTRSELTADLELDQQALIQGGENGLAVSRLRTRREDGQVVSQVSESESIVRPPRDQVLGFGTKIVIRTIEVDGVNIEYWRALTLYATSYSPCRSGTDRCLYGTSSGLPAGNGVVAMVYSWYLAFGFENLFIPGYGHAVVGDVGAGPANSHFWIDLGYSDESWQPWSGNVTVYFLTPVPANPVYVLP